MNNLAMVACISQDRGIGKDQELLWHIPEDMKFFRELTTGGTVVMGGKTFRSLGKPLPKRENLVLSRSNIDVEGVQCFNDRAKLDRYLKNCKDVYIIGGSSLYEAYLPLAERLYLTEVDGVRPANVFFPEFNRVDYAAKVLQSGEYNGIKWRTVEYTRLKGKNDHASETHARGEEEHRG